jgi:arsenate reductase
MIQVFGTKKCKNTKKAQRFFQERGKAFQFIDLNEKAIAGKELDHFLQGREGEDMMDKTSKAWQSGGFTWREFNAREEILENNGLLITPLIRFDQKFFVGFDPKDLQGLL